MVGERSGRERQPVTPQIMDLPPEPPAPFAAPEPPAPSAWTSPDSTTVAPAPSAGGASRSEPAIAAPAVPLAVRLRPRTALGVLDAGFDLLIRHWVDLMAVTLVVMVPLVAVPRALMTGLSTNPANEFLQLFHVNTRDQVRFSTTSSYQNGWSSLVTLMGMVAIGLLGLGISHLVSGWVVGGSPTVGGALGVIVRRGWVVVVASVVSLPIRFAGLLACGVGLIFVLAWLLMVSPVIALEGVGPLAAIGRSWRMANRRMWSCLGIVVVGSLVIQLATGLVALLLGGLAGLVLGVGTGLVWAVGAIQLVVTLLTVPVQVIWAVLAYFDIRVRSEGLDLELQLADTFAPRSAVAR